jgi:hypothetical protein
VIQTVILAELDGLNTPNANGHKPLIDNDPAKINEAYFEHVDFILNEAEKLGLYVGLLPTWGDKFNLKWGVGPEIFTPENAEIYGEILGKRYHSQKNIIWILGGDRMPKNETQYKIINALASGIKSKDTLHLMTYHPEGGHFAADKFNTEEWLDFDMFQSGHTREANEYNYVIKGRSVVPVRPVINGEARYENIPDRFWEPGELIWMDDADVRTSAYWSMLSGAAGYTYGCNDIWQMYSIGREPTISARTGWKTALQLPGSMQMKYLKDLFIAIPWQTMVNDQSLILNDNPQDSTYMMSAIGIEKDYILVYTPYGKPITPDLSQMNSDEVQAYWFNPRSGKSMMIGRYSAADKPIFTPWSTGRGSDFVLVLINEDTEYSLPE